MHTWILKDSGFTGGRAWPEAARRCSTSSQGTPMATASACLKESGAEKQEISKLLSGNLSWFRNGSPQLSAPAETPNHTVTHFPAMGWRGELEAPKEGG